MKLPAHSELSTTRIVCKESYLQVPEEELALEPDFDPANSSGDLAGHKVLSSAG